VAGVPSTPTTDTGFPSSDEPPASCSHIASTIGWRNSCPSCRVITPMVSGKILKHVIRKKLAAD